jgi:hypothetical protein
VAFSSVLALASVAAIPYSVHDRRLWRLSRAERGSLHRNGDHGTSQLVIQPMTIHIRHLKSQPIHSVNLNAALGIFWAPDRPLGVVLNEAWAARCSYCERCAAHASPPPGQTHIRSARTDMFEATTSRPPLNVMGHPDHYDLAI